MTKPWWIIKFLISLFSFNCEGNKTTKQFSATVVNTFVSQVKDPQFKTVRKHKSSQKVT